MLSDFRQHCLTSYEEEKIFVIFIVIRLKPWFTKKFLKEITIAFVILTRIGEGE